MQPLPNSPTSCYSILSPITMFLAASYLPSLPGTHCNRICHRAFALAVPSARNSLSPDFDPDGSFSPSVAQMLPPVRGLLIIYMTLYYYNHHFYFNLKLSYFFKTYLLLSAQLWNLKAVTKASHNIQQALNKLIR